MSLNSKNDESSRNIQKTESALQPTKFEESVLSCSSKNRENIGREGQFLLRSTLAGKYGSEDILYSGNAEIVTGRFIASVSIPTVDTTTGEVPAHDLMNNIDGACRKTLPETDKEIRFAILRGEEPSKLFRLIGRTNLRTFVPFDCVTSAFSDDRIPMYNQRFEFLLFEVDGKKMVYFGIVGQHFEQGVIKAKVPDKSWHGVVFSVVDWSICPQVLQDALLNRGEA